MKTFAEATTTELIEYDREVGREIEACEPTSTAARDWLRTRKLIRAEIDRRNSEERVTNSMLNHAISPYRTTS